MRNRQPFEVVWVPSSAGVTEFGFPNKPQRAGHLSSVKRCFVDRKEGQGFSSFAESTVWKVF